MVPFSGVALFVGGLLSMRKDIPDQQLMIAAILVLVLAAISIVAVLFL
jgi:hypothetical protein